MSSKLNGRDYTLQFRRGLFANLNLAITKLFSADGEPYWTTDTKELWVAQDGNLYGAGITTAICHEGEVITYNNEIVHG